MFKIIILLCSASLQPPDCTPVTADQVTRISEAKHGLASCMVEGMTIAVRLGYVQQGKNYIKVVCKGE